jgi:hypothetical protein
VNVRPGLGVMLLLTVGVMALALPSSAAAVTPGEWSANANATCAKPAKLDAKLFERAIRLFNQGHERRSARLFIRSQRIELGYVNALAKLPRPDDPAFGALIEDWVTLQGNSARLRIRFARAVLAGKARKTLARLDNAARRAGLKAVDAGKPIGLTEC